MEQDVFTEAQQECAFCGNHIRHDNASSEHIIPNAIGGRKRVEGFLCRDCNSTTGSSWDHELARQLNPVCNLLNIKRQRGTPPTLEVATTGGRRLRHRSDGHLSADRTRVSERRLKDKIAIRITAPNMRELKRHLPGLIRKYPQLADVDLLKHAVPTREYLDDPFAIKLEFGGLQAGRSVVKSCVALAHLAGVRLEGLELAQKYLSGEDEPCFGYFNENDPVLNRPEGIFFHCVHVQGNEKTGKVLGYVEYFGYERIVVVPSDSYRGPQFSACYAVDPVTGNEIPLSVELPDFTEQEIEDIYDYKRVDNDKSRIALESLLQSYTESAGERERTRTIKHAIDYAFDNCGAKPGEQISPEQGKQLIDLLKEQLIPFMLHQAGFRVVNHADEFEINRNLPGLDRSDTVPSVK